MKLFKNLFRLNTPKDTICGYHNDKIMPNLRPLGISI